MEKKGDLSERLFAFAVNVLKYLKSIESTIENKVMKYQLPKSATSSGANFKEAQAGSSTADFLNKIKISLREMRESNYWIRICNELKLGSDSQCNMLMKESEELMKILGSIAS